MNTASTSSAAHTVEDVVPFVIVALVLLFAAWRLGGRRRRRGADSGPGSDPGADSPADESGE